MGRGSSSHNRRAARRKAIDKAHEIAQDAVEELSAEERQTQEKKTDKK